MNRKGELIDGRQALHCANCDKPTFLRSVSFEAPMCSLECEESYTGGYVEEVAQGKDDDECYRRFF